MDIQGICPIAPAVFDAEGRVDIPGYRRCLEGMIRLGADALTLFGIAGEYYKLDHDEEERLLDATVAVCRAHGIPSIVSNTRHATEVAVPWARRIAAAGADCMMVLPPFFLKPAGPALFDHLDAVCAAVDLPVMLQYAPDQTGVAIAPEAMAALARRHANLRYFKIECKPPGAYIARLRPMLDRDRRIFVGNAGFQMVEGFRRGAAGVMPGPSMVDVYRKIWDGLREGRDADAQSLHDRLNALLNHIRQDVEMIIHYEKEILRRRGLTECAYCRRPGFVPDPVADALFETLYAGLQGEFAAC